MQVLLINPRSGFLEDPTFVPPLGLLYLGAALEDQGLEPCVVDLNLSGTTIDGYNPRLIGISCVTANFAAVRKLVSECRFLYPEVPVVVGGPHLSVRPMDGERLGADWTGTGDCEVSLPRLCTMLDTGLKIRSGVLCNHSKVDVNHYPIPARHLVPIREYSCTVDDEPATSIVSQRGCPYGCAFCSRWPGSREVRARAVDNIIEEIMYLKGVGFRAFVFHDDEINLLNSRLLELCRRLEPEDVHFKANARADLFTPDQAEALATAGCTWLCVGVESGSAAILKTVTKGSTPVNNSRARRICRDFGIRFKAFIIVGLPGETRETIEETRRWLIENEVDDLTITMFVPFPGTAVHENPSRYDVQFDLDYEHSPLPFRGAAGLALPWTTWTPGLCAEELAELPELLEGDVRKELGIKSRPSRKSCVA